MITVIQRELKESMQKALAALEIELRKIRAGSANVEFLDSIRVDYYGNLTPLAQVAHVAVENTRTLTVTPWEKNMLGKIEKAILTSGLGLTPISQGLCIRVPFPALTEERRDELMKLVKKVLENSRVAVRTLRREANQSGKTAVKDKLMSEDEERSLQNGIQKITDETIQAIEKIGERKERELKEV